MVMRYQRGILFVLFFIILPFLLLSCRAERVLFAVDEIMYETGYFTPKRTRKLESVARREGVRLEVVSISFGENTEAVINREIDRVKPDRLVLSPLLATYAESLREKREVPSVIVVLFRDVSGLAAEKATPCGKIVISKEKALRELGNILGGYPAVRGVWYVGDSASKKEYEIFIDAYHGGGADTINIMEAENLDPTVLLDHISAGESPEGSVGIVFAAEMTYECVEAFREKGIGIASEYLFLDEYPQADPLFSVQFPLTGVVEAVVKDPPGPGEIKKVDALLLKRE